MEKNYVVGIDVGGHSVKVGIVSKDARILANGGFDTRTFGDGEAEKFMDSLCDLILKLVDTAGIGIDEIKGIGIGAPNSNHFTGCIEYAVNLPWAAREIVPICKYVSKKLGLPVDITNDANAAAMGEMAYGAARGMKNFIMITLGTGVGSGIVIDGKMVYGHDGFAGELGHVNVVRNNGRTCGCGRQGCLEAYCSAIGVARTAREWLDATDEASLLRDVENITSKDVYDAAKKGDALALRIFDYTGTLLGRTFADFIAFSAPEAIVLFGGLARSKEFLIEPMQKAMNDNVLKIWKNKVKIVFSQLKESDAAILGASALAWEL